MAGEAHVCQLGQMGNVCVLIAEAWLLLGSTLTLCPDDSRSELATAGKLLELLCEPSSRVCGLCFGSVSSRSSSQSPFVMDGSV